MDPLLDHERLDIYQMARQFNRALVAYLEHLPRGQADSKDNLTRATKSVTRNIAEGSGKWRIRDKGALLSHARGPATECAASLDGLVDFGVASDDQSRELKDPLSRVVAMLIAMIRSLESRGGPDTRR